MSQGLPPVSNPAARAVNRDGEVATTKRVIARYLTTGTSPTDPLPHALTKPTVKPLLEVTQNH